MTGIEQAFGDQVEVIFYDVWDDPAPANEYGIQIIPTQIFLDENGEEFHRHTGFYPQADIEALLVERGLEKIADPVARGAGADPHQPEQRPQPVARLGFAGGVRVGRRQHRLQPLPPGQRAADRRLHLHPGRRLDGARLSALARLRARRPRVHRPDRHHHLVAREDVRRPRRDRQRGRGRGLLRLRPVPHGPAAAALGQPVPRVDEAPRHARGAEPRPGLRHRPRSLFLRLSRPSAHDGVRARRAPATCSPPACSRPSPWGTAASSSSPGRLRRRPRRSSRGAAARVSLAGCDAAVERSSRRQAST